MDSDVLTNYDLILSEAECKPDIHVRVSCTTSWAYISEYALLVDLSYNLHKDKEPLKLWNDSNANTLHNVACLLYTSPSPRDA